MTQEADSRRCSSRTGGRKRPGRLPDRSGTRVVQVARWPGPGVPVGTGGASVAQAGGRGGDDAPGAGGGLETIPAIEDLVAQWLLLHRLLEGVDDLGVELPVRPGGDRLHRFVERVGGAIGALAGEGVIGLADADDPRAERDTVAADADRVAIAAPVLVVMEHDRHDVLQLRDARQQLGAVDRVVAEACLL